MSHRIARQSVEGEKSYTRADKDSGGEGVKPRRTHQEKETWCRHLCITPSLLNRGKRMQRGKQQNHWTSLRTGRNIKPKNQNNRTTAKTYRAPRGLRKALETWYKPQQQGHLQRERLGVGARQIRRGRNRRQTLSRKFTKNTF